MIDNHARSVSIVRTDPFVRWPSRAACAILPPMRYVAHLTVVAGLGALLALAAAPALAADSAPNAKTAITHADAEKAEKLVKEKKVVVVDVRTPAEYDAGHIAGAKNIDFQAPEFEQRLGALDKGKTCLVHCAAGGRSTRSLEVFKKLGFKEVVHLDGGFKAWEKAQKPVEKR